MKKDVREFINAIEKETKRNDSKALVKIMEEETGYKGALHGSIIGFGRYHYKYDSGHEGDSNVVGFSPRAQNLTVYIMPGFSEYQKELAKLGKHKTSVSCLYIKKLADIDEKILRKIIKHAVKVMQKRYDCSVA